MSARDEATFFATPDAWRDWLVEHHATVDELWVGFHKRATGKPSLTWPQAVDGALCFGWIDGVRQRIDEDAYRIRFTPRRPGSIWSAVNVRRAHALVAEGLMTPAGLRAFEARDERRTALYAYEQRSAAFAPEDEARFRKAKRAWRFWESAPPSYRRLATHWVASAKRPETRARRLATLIAESAAGRHIGPTRRES